ncbi:hypothetical protein AYY16_05900 [Morganella psychrotolerans]|nr:hypothetical protein [Morganella psychrotolerans]OBU08775.1 hypothetical protein AYY16_05900 [Morganella psychrotolerans]
MGDFKINNHNESDSDSLSIDNILINSLNVKQNIQRGPDEYTYSLRDNSLIINNNGLFSIFRLSVTGNQYDNVLISNEGTILSDKIDIKASTVRMINNNTFEVRSELDVDSINGFYTFGDNKILVSNKILNM